MAGYRGFSKSNNAVDAERTGLLVATDAARALNVSVSAIREFLDAAEWHHTSKFYNEVNYYDVDDIEPEILTKMKAFTKVEKAKKTNSKKMYGTIKYLIWSGTRKHPTAENCEFTGEVVERGCFYYFDGMRKKIDSNGTYFKEQLV